ncbi:MAG: sulfite exporter TauE/SafE family protein [Nitrospinota bacterium]
MAMDPTVLTPAELTAAFMMGFVGGLHCVGMCGPIVALFSLKSEKQRVLGYISYHLARTTSYILLGIVFGLLGALITDAIPLLTAQKGLLIVAGAFMVFFALQIGGWVPDRYNLLPLISIPGSFLNRAAKGDSLLTSAIIGLMNGFLPCGLVYGALALALATSSPISGGIIMALFGIGTIPALLAIPFVFRLFSVSKRAKLLKIAASFIILFGSFMVYKALFILGERPIKMGIMIQEKLENDRNGPKL